MIDTPTKEKATPEEVAKNKKNLQKNNISSKEQNQRAGKTKKKDGLGILFQDVEAWHEAVDGDDLLDEINHTIRRFIACDTETSIAASLWVVMTWLIDEVHVLPLAVITSPEMRCGKTQLLTVMSKLSNRPLSVSNITAAALFRTIELYRPTLFVDEADTFMKKK